MIIKIPTIKKVFENNQVIKQRGEMQVHIDTSFLAHLKWEEQFGGVLGCDLTTYTERVRSWVKDESVAKANFLGMLKLLYCYVNSDSLPTFKDFCALFDYEVADQVLTRIGTVLDEVTKTISKN